MFAVLILGCGLILAAGDMAGASTNTVLLVGVATTDITPLGPVALAGQMHTRISQGVRSPLTATAIALESRYNGKVADQAIIISCDLISVPEEILDGVRRNLKDCLPEFDGRKIIISATHTHTAPVLEEGRHNIPEKGVIQPAEYIRFLTGQVSDLAEKAWRERKPGGVSWGLGHAMVAQNRRALYAAGRARMYGKTNDPEFRGIEGYEDHDVDVLFFWNEDKKLFATAITVACPAQTVENNSSIDADYWHEVRENLKEKYSPELKVLGWIGAAGDQSPHIIYRKGAEERMRRLRGLGHLQEIGRRITRAVNEAYEAARKEIRTDPVMMHKVNHVKLPLRRVTEQELAAAKARVDSLSGDPDKKARLIWHKRVIDRYERQKTNPYYDMELHVVRLGDVAICTNPFELFTDFGIQIKARSKALQTFVIQLAGPGSYIPTQKAVRGGDYSTGVESNLVGPEGGEVLVDRTVEQINSLWAEGQ